MNPTLTISTFLWSEIIANNRDLLISTLAEQLGIYDWCPIYNIIPLIQIEFKTKSHKVEFTLKYLQT